MERQITITDKEAETLRGLIETRMMAIRMAARVAVGTDNQEAAQEAKVQEAELLELTAKLVFLNPLEELGAEIRRYVDAANTAAKYGSCGELVATLKKLNDLSKPVNALGFRVAYTINKAEPDILIDRVELEPLTEKVTP